MNDEKYEKDPADIGALWERDSARGTYMSGTIGGVKVVVFKNTRKTADAQPDWRVLKSLPKDERPARVTVPPDPDPNW